MIRQNWFTDTTLFLTEKRFTIYLTLHWVCGSTGKNSKILKEVVKDTDLSYILLETDAPYLSPEPYRGKRNDSSYIGEIAKVIAELKEVTILDVSRSTTANAEGLFDFSLK